MPVVMQMPVDGQEIATLLLSGGADETQLAAPPVVGLVAVKALPWSIAMQKLEEKQEMPCKAVVPSMSVTVAAAEEPAAGAAALATTAVTAEVAEAEPEAFVAVTTALTV